jgi:gluconate kinase
MGVMGTAGYGKYSLGQALVNRKEWSDYDGEDYRPPGIIQLFAAGISLLGHERYVWLLATCKILDIKNGNNLILTCSEIINNFH